MRGYARAKRWHPGVMICAVMLGVPVFAGDNHHHGRDRVYTFKGAPVTGINDLCGKPLWTFDYPPPLAADFRTPNFGVYDPRPGATDSLPLTPENCKPDTVVATIVDPAFAAYINVGPNDVDARLKNLPIRDVPAPILFQSLRAPLPQLDALPAETSAVARFKSQPSNPITLGEWLRARAELTIRCTAAGPATAYATFRNLVPNGLYSVWGSWSTTPEGAPGPAVVPIPFGGAPNSLIADYKGDATYLRKFAACPLDPVPDAGGSKMLFVALVYHSDAVLYGASPGPFQEKLHFQAADGSTYQSFAIPGIIIHDHLIFPTAGTRINN